MHRNGHRQTGTPRWKLLMKYILVAASAITVGACSTGMLAERDGAPHKPTDIAAIPNAVPRAEPLSKYGNPTSYEVRGQRYQVMSSSAGYVERGIASWYGTKFHNRRTSSGEPYNMYAMTAAHKTLPLPTYVEVTNLESGRSIIVKVNDRGPFEKNRLIDLSYVAAEKLGITASGTGFVEVRAIDPRHKRPNPPVTATNISDHTNVYLQVGAFVTHFKAEQMVARVNRVLPVGAQIREGFMDKRVYYRVRIGPISNVAEADRIAAILTESGIEAPRIVTD